jgi:hypothetical protein
MHATDKTKQILDAERRILSLLCQTPARGAIRNELERAVADYSWREHEHQVIFEALQEISRSDSKTIREQLPARLTRKGFPDLDLETYFQPRDPGSSQSARSIRTLLKLLRDVARL